MSRACAVCGIHSITPVCDRCERLRAIGIIVGTAVALDEEVLRIIPGERYRDHVLNDLSLDVLDAAAYLLRDRARLRAHMNKAISDEQRAAQRDARDAFAEGKDEGRREGRGEW